LALVLLLGVAGCEGNKPDVEAQEVSSSGGAGPAVVFTTHRAASVVIGQPDFVSNASNSPTIGAQTMFNPYGRVTVAGGNN
jgi:hypothetical protein